MVNGCDSCKMYDASNETSWGVRGLYWHEDKYYCIWAEGRSLSEQKSTEMHEHCHYLVDQDYEHFCVENY